MIALPCTLYVEEDDDDRDGTFLPLLAAVVTLARQNVFKSQRNEKYLKEKIEVQCEGVRSQCDFFLLHFSV